MTPCLKPTLIGLAFTVPGHNDLCFSAVALCHIKPICNCFDVIATSAFSSLLLGSSRSVYRQRKNRFDDVRTQRVTPKRDDGERRQNKPGNGAEMNWRLIQNKYNIKIYFWVNIIYINTYWTTTNPPWTILIINVNITKQNSNFLNKLHEVFVPKILRCDYSRYIPLYRQNNKYTCLFHFQSHKWCVFLSSFNLNVFLHFV